MIFVTSETFPLAELYLTNWNRIAQYLEITQFRVFIFEICVYTPCVFILFSET